ncbi:MAG: nicotinate-nucleotide--dimethylbenzimidazole phosphoribosyltransferase, partial [Gammaproteobacteria bacterium]|nr:nicotinate-nucleotide--dimethylbenzimidazole phosphoribosyltransferase [Gammaproteobacteria bacterium]
MNWWTQPTQAIDLESREQATLRQQQLTKPPGSLGELENVAIAFAGWQSQEIPQLNCVCVRIFAADHGVVEEGVSAYPQVVTGEMVRNFAAGGAAICVLSKIHNAEFSVVNVGTVMPLEDLPGVANVQLTNGTANFCKQPAMTGETVIRALDVGRNNSPQESDLFIGGEMGIGNTTSATAIFCALLGASVQEMTGRGTGIDDTGLKRKAETVQAALNLHREHIASGALETLRCVGGLEIAALAGAYITCAQRGIPSLVDGFISTAAALVAIRLNEGVRDWLLFAHCSDEQGHKQALSMMNVTPLLSIRMRLGEGSVAA